MGLRNRQRTRPVAREVLSHHNHHPRVTWADWEVAKLRLERRAKREKNDAEWEMAQGWKRHNLPRGE